MRETKKKDILLQLEGEIDSGLLFQFLLSEIFLAKKGIKRVLQLDFTQKQEVEVSLKELKKLAGAHRDSICYWAWFPCEGIISRLRRYAIAYACKQSSNFKASQLICHLSTHALTKSRECLEHCFNISLENYTGRERVVVQVKNLINTLAELFDELGHNILEEFEQFHSDENVIYFLLRHCREIDELIEYNWMGKKLNQIFPGGISAVGEYLQNRYNKRQYDHLLPIISNYIAAL